MRTNSAPPFASPFLRRVLGDALRPGGPEGTRSGLGRCAFAPHSLLLDLGCGPGASLRLARESGFCCLGLDVSRTFLNEARLHGPVLQADMHRLPVRDACLDGVICECVLSLARRKDRVLDEVRRVLKPGGTLLLGDIVRAGNAAPRPDGGICPGGAESTARVRQRLEKAGFVVLDVLDMTRAMRELAARIVLEFGTLETFWRLWLPEDPGAPCRPACAAGSHGYVQFIAR